MVDPLSEVITLLRPRTAFSKLISGAGRWGVRYSAFEQPSFCTVLEGSCRLTVDGQESTTLKAGDFVLMPATPGFTMTGFVPVTPEQINPKTMPSPTGEVRHGRRGGRPDVRMLGGYFLFDSPDAALLVSLLPVLLHVRGVERLSVLVKLVREESLEQRPGRPSVIDDTIATNLTAPLQLTAALLPHLEAQPKATVLTVSSGLAFTPLALTPTYSTTKAAIHAWSIALRYQLRETSVEVLELAPPYVQTELMGEQQAKDPNAMPLADFISETMDLLSAQTDAKEILVKRVYPLRFAGGFNSEKFYSFVDQFNAAMSGH